MSGILHLQKVVASPHHNPHHSLLPTSITRSIGTLHGLDPEFDDQVSLLQSQLSPESPSSHSPSPSIRYLKKKSTMEEIKIQGIGIFESGEGGAGAGAGAGAKEGRLGGGKEGGRGGGGGEGRGSEGAGGRGVGGGPGRGGEGIEYQEKESFSPVSYGRKWRTEKKWENLKRKLIKMYTNKTVLLFGFMSLVVLFAYDMKRAYFCSQRYDAGFDVVLGIIMAVFLIENIISAIIKQEIHFFYYVDLFATLTIILDFTTVDKKIYELLSIIRLFRLLKLYKFLSNIDISSLSFTPSSSTSSSSPNPPSTSQVLQSFLDNHKPSNENNLFHIRMMRRTRITKKVTRLIFRKIVVSFILILFLIPFLGGNLLDYSDAYYYMQDYAKEVGGGETELNLFSNFLKNADFGRLISLQCEGELMKSNYEDRDAMENVDFPEKLRFESEQIMAQTGFIIIILLLFSYYFHREAFELIHQPFNRLIKTVNQISTNPLAVRYEVIKKKKKREERASSRKQEGAGSTDLQSFVIENAIIKITNLLMLGFGEAGMEIFLKNVRDHGEMNTEVQGRRRCGVFGVCDVRNFTDISLVLQEDVLVFVNTIAEIVHSNVDLCFGAPNKVFGDSFLLVWKFNEEDYVSVEGKLVFKNRENASVLCDLALLSFLNILAKMETDTRIQDYNSNKKLKVRWEDKILQHPPPSSLSPPFSPNFGPLHPSLPAPSALSIPAWKVKLSMGLHLGWAFEGAIGTQYKIDAGYISNDISMSFVLSEISKNLDCPPILSNEFFNSLSPDLRKFCKPVERINFGGSSQIVFCVQHNLENIRKKERLVNKYENREAFQKAHKRKKMEFAELLEKKGFNFTEYINKKKNIKAMLELNNEEYLEKFGKGFDKYAKGMWGEAKKVFESLLEKKEDAVIRRIMGYMSKKGFQAPEGWKGVELVGTFD